MRHGLERHEDIRLALLALIELTNPGLIAHRKVGGFDKRPRQILIPILRVALPFAFPITQLGAAHTPAVGGNLTDRGEPANLARLSHDREGQRAANARDGQQRLKRGAEFHAGMHRSFHLSDLLGEVVHHCHRDLKRDHGPDGRGGQVFELIAPQSLPRVPRQ